MNGRRCRARGRSLIRLAGRGSLLLVLLHEKLAELHQLLEAGVGRRGQPGSFAKQPELHREQASAQ